MTSPLPRPLKQWGGLPGCGGGGWWWGCPSRGGGCSLADDSASAEFLEISRRELTLSTLRAFTSNGRAAPSASDRGRSRRSSSFVDKSSHRRRRLLHQYVLACGPDPRPTTLELLHRNLLLSHAAGRGRCAADAVVRLIPPSSLRAGARAPGSTWP